MKIGLPIIIIGSFILILFIILAFTISVDLIKVFLPIGIGIFIIMFIIGIVYLSKDKSEQFDKKLKYIKSNHHEQFYKSNNEKTVNQIWIGKVQPLPDPIKQYYMKSVKNMAIKNNVKYRLWGNKDITKKNFPILYDRIKWCIKKKRPWAMICDLMRLEILLLNGGMYLDTNFEILKPEKFGSIFKENKGVFTYENEKILTNSFLYTPKPGNSTILNCINDLLTKTDSDFMKSPNKITGPSLISANIISDDIKLDYNLLFPYTPWTGRGGNDKCLSKTQKPNFKPLGNKYVINDCKLQYKDAWAIDHFENDGGSWI
jgi:mannosyltransferase OCH1-like enzyme